MGFATAAAIATIAGTALSAVGMVQQGQAQKKASEYQARQMEANAKTENALAQRRAMQERRKANILQSNLQARAAAGGGGALDPSIVDLGGDIAAEGEMRALSALWEGEERGKGLMAGAGAARYEGAQAARAGYMGAGATVLSGAGSLFSKYGKGGSKSELFNPADWET
jgi:hypothetical protein